MVIDRGEPQLRTSPMPNPVPSGSRLFDQQHLLLAAILAGAFLVRVWGLNFGLPDVYHWDEYTDFYNAIWAANDGLRMGNFVGASLPYLLLVIYWLVFLVFWITGKASDFSSFESLLFADLSPAILGGRIVAVIVSVATVWLTYKTAILMYGELNSLNSRKRVGLIAAALLAFTSLYVQDSHYARGHVFAAFFILLVLNLSYRIVKEQKTRYYVLAGVCIALATGTEFYAPTAAVLLLAGHLLGIHQQGLRFNVRNIVLFRPFLLGCISAVLVFLAITPAALLDLGYFLAWMRWYVQDNNGAWVDPEGLPVAVFYLTEHLRNGMGEPFLLLTLIGLGFLLWHHRKPDILLLSFPLVFFYILHKGPNHARFALPLLPFFAITVAVLLDAFYRRLRLANRSWGILLAGVLVLILLPSLTDIVRFDTYLGLPDTRLAAREWIERNVPENATIVVEGGHGSLTHAVAGPQLSKNKALLTKMLQERPNAAEKRFVEMMLNSPPRSPVFEVYDVIRLENITAIGDFRKVQYVVTSSWALTKSARASEYEELLANEYRLVASFEPNPEFKFDPYTWRMDYGALRATGVKNGNNVAGPRLEVYQRKTAGEG